MNDLDLNITISFQKDNNKPYFNEAVGDEMKVLVSYFKVRHEIHDSYIVNLNITLVSRTRYSLTHTV